MSLREKFVKNELEKIYQILNTNLARVLLVSEANSWDGIKKEKNCLN